MPEHPPARRLRPAPRLPAGVRHAGLPGVGCPPGRSPGLARLNKHLPQPSVSVCLSPCLWVLARPGLASSPALGAWTALGCLILPGDSPGAQSLIGPPSRLVTRSPASTPRPAFALPAGLHRRGRQSCLLSWHSWQVGLLFPLRPGLGKACGRALGAPQGCIAPRSGSLPGTDLSQAKGCLWCLLILQETSTGVNPPPSASLPCIWDALGSEGLT